MRDIILKITGKTESVFPKQKEEPDYFELLTKASLSERGGISYITYDESELSGMKGCKTAITISSEKMKVKRSGEMLSGDTAMEFEKGRHYFGTYETPMGSIPMEILTESFEDKVAEDGKRVINANYALSLKGLLEARKTLKIEISELENDKEEKESRQN